MPNYPAWFQQIVDMAPRAPTPVTLDKPPSPAVPTGTDNTKPVAPKQGTDGGAGANGRVRPFDDTTPRAPKQGADGGAGGNGGRHGQVRAFDNTTARAPKQGTDGGAGANGGRHGQVRAFDNTTPRAHKVGADGGAGGNGQVRPVDDKTPRAPKVGADGGAGAIGSTGVDAPATPPKDPKQFTEWWQPLSREQKNWVYSRDPFIGNHPGMPFEDKTLYNEQHLPELIANAQSNVDAMQARYDQLARQVYMGDHSAATGNEMAALGPKLQAAKHSLAEYRGVQNAMNAPPGTPKRYLGFLDDKGHAAVSIGNPDTATRNAILVPGTGDDLTTMSGNTDRATAMWGAALKANPRLQPGDVAVTAWFGYDRPMSVLEQAPWPSYAQHGAGALDSFESGMRASHVGAPSVDTVVGHSYGTALVGAAASGEHRLAADNVVAVASPGMLADHAGDLNINPGGTVYAMTDPHDPIGPANLFTQFTLGPDPTGASFGAHNLYAGSGAGSGPGGLIPTGAAHGSYWDPGTPSLKNLGAVIAKVPAPFPAGR
jgi:hypothetical protein